MLSLTASALAGALLLMPSGSIAASPQDYADHAVSAIQTLNAQWYDAATGIWDGAWWNSANVLTTLADFTSLRLGDANGLNLGGYMLNTWQQAQKVHVATVKTFDEEGIPVSTNCMGDGCRRKREFRGSVRKRQFDDFTNTFMDDNFWWNLGLIRAFDVTGDARYLDSAVTIFDETRDVGLGGPCNGGMYWNTDREYVNAITNELYLFAAASLANRIPEDPKYLRIAKEQWSWFKASGMINDDNLINDGLDANCKNNGLQTWSYNQGVILGALTELSRATGDASLIDEAHAIAAAAIEHLSSGDGVLIETDNCELLPGNCGRDGQQFKGIFVRNLRYLHEASPKAAYRDFITKNADVIWANNRNDENMLGVAWNGPFVSATGMSQSAALDVLVAAIAVA
jgi:predicted alpha-1,6-mannanase (GH76 family)